MRLAPPCPFPARRLALVLASAMLVGSRSLRPEDVGATVPPGGTSAEDLERRRKALDAWTFEPVALEATAFLLHLDRRDGSFFFQDRRTGVKWFSSWGRRGFASVLVDGSWLPLDRIDQVRPDDRRILFRASAGEQGLVFVGMEVEVLPDLRGVAISFEVPAESRALVARVRLLDGCLWIPDADGGGAAVPLGMGEWLPVDGPDFRRRLGAPPADEVPGGKPRRLELSFLGLTKGVNPVLLRWADPGAAIEVGRAAMGDPKFPGSAAIAVSVEFAGSSGRIELRTLGKEWSPVVDAARAYLSTLGSAAPSLRSKVGARPELRSFDGAPLFRPVAGPGLGFEAIAGAAERISREVGIESGAVVISGWQEPDSRAVEARKDAGGGAALRECSRRVRELGYLFGLEEEGPATSWKEALRVARDDERFEALQDLAAPQILLVRERAAFRLGDPTEVEARAAWAGLAVERFGLVAARPGAEGDIARLSLFEGLLDHLVREPMDPTFWPVFTAAVGHCVRVSVSPEMAVGPGDAATVLVHLLVGEVPVYRIPSDSLPEGWEKDPRFCFASGDGWASAKKLTPPEAFLRNTYEVLSHVARLRSRELLLYHRKLVPDGSVRESWFGPDLRIVVNLGSKEYTDSEDGFVLPPMGFYVRDPFLLAFHALRANEVNYERPAFFVVRSLEGKMYLRAEQVMVYHGFGPDRIDLGAKTFHVATEAVVKIW